jgi:hypothetical protein
MDETSFVFSAIILTHRTEHKSLAPLRISYSADYAESLFTFEQAAFERNG